MVKFVELSDGNFLLTVKIGAFEYVAVLKLAEKSVDDAMKENMKENGLYIEHPDNLYD